MPSEPRTRHQLYHAEALAPLAATRVLVVAIVALYGLQIGLGSLGVQGLAASAIGDVGVLAGLVLYMRSNGLRPVHLGLRRPRRRYLAAGALIGVSAWCVTLYLVVLLQPPGDTRGLEELVEQTPLVPTLLAIGVLPPIVEEILFRGVFARALTMRFVPAAAVVLSALAFAVFHLLPPQMVSTFVLGLALAFLTLRADSVVPAILAHLFNNVMVILISRDELPGVGPWITDHAAVSLVIACALSVAGLAVAAGGRR